MGRGRADGGGNGWTQLNCRGGNVEECDQKDQRASLAHLSSLGQQQQYCKIFFQKTKLSIVKEKQRQIKISPW